MTPPEPQRHAPTGVDTSVPHSARIWNYWQGGKDHYEVDRVAGDAFGEKVPEIRGLARASRAWLLRAVRWTVTEGGIRQLLDIGAGLPGEINVHEIAQNHDRTSRVVYVDHDPMVLSHVGALLDSTPEGATAYVDADMRDVDQILAEAKETLDFTKPIGLVFSDCLGHITDTHEVYDLVRRTVDGIPSGSYLVLSHGAPSPRLSAATDDYAKSGGIPYILRTPEEIGRFFEGLDLVEPGLVPMPTWHPDVNTQPLIADVGWGAVARIP